MAQPFNKFQRFVEDVNEGVHNLASHTLKILLTNVAPVATAGLKADWTEITAGSGYVAGGPTVTITSSAQSSGTYKLVGNDVTVLASGGSIGPFRYAVIYNDTPSSPADPGIGWWDKGQSVTLNDGDSFTLDLDATNGILQMV